MKSVPVYGLSTEEEASDTDSSLNDVMVNALFKSVLEDEYEEFERRENYECDSENELSFMWVPEKHYKEVYPAEIN